MWDVIERKQVSMLKLDQNADGTKAPKNSKTKEMDDEYKARCIDIISDGKVAAVGYRKGTVKVFETEHWTSVSEVKYHDAWIQDLKFSPDKKHLAVSSHKGKV